mgnify:CR=1 FL=1
MLLTVVVFGAVGPPLRVRATIEGLVSEAYPIILRFAIISLHPWKEKLVAHRRVEVRQRAVLVLRTALRVPLLPRITHAVFH